jgi:cysteine desulfurase
MIPETYLDHASAMPVRPAAARAMTDALSAFADPIQGHEAGREASRALEEAREHIAGALGAQADEIVFTSGGTESVSLAILGMARARREAGTRVVLSAIEHPSVHASARTLAGEGFEIETVPVDATGRADIDAFAAAVRARGTVLATLQHTNHEVGTLQAVAEAARLSRETGVLFHTDAAQAAGRLPVDVRALGVDALSVSGHKFGAPPGIGALFVRRGTPLLGHPSGDARERHRRAGAENLPGAAAMAAALAEAVSSLADEAAREWALTDRLRAGLAGLDGVLVHGHPTHRAPHLVCFTVEEADPETLLMALDERGFRVSCGCIERGIPGEASPVLEAMGWPHAVGFRVSVGPGTGTDDVERFLEATAELTRELRRIERASHRSLARGSGGAPSGA